MSNHSVLAGSFRRHPELSRSAGKPQPDQIVQITLVLRRRSAAPELVQHSTNHLTRRELAELHGAHPDDLQAVEAFAAAQGFTVCSKHTGARTVVLSGPLARLSAAFGADIELRATEQSVLRTRQGHLHLPEALTERVIAVLGFDERPVAATNHHLLASRVVQENDATSSIEPHAQPASFTPVQLADLYNFPKSNGAGQTIALIELGGGYNDADLHQYWNALGLSDVSVSAVSVDGAHNAPTGDPNGPDGEVVLDIEVAGAVAPGAHIAVYFAPNTDQGFLNAVLAAIHDDQRKPSILSISWGSAEVNWTPQALFAFHAAFHDAALMGITVLAAAGDNGSSDGLSTERHVDFPASSPWVLACGGTRLLSSDGQIAAETVWNNSTHGGATGGGVSSFFARPQYQNQVAVPAPPPSTTNVNPTGRGVPDVAAVADPETGYTIYLDGRLNVIGGTSAVAPLWAGLFAICNQQLGKNVGWPHPFLYGTVAAHKVLHDIEFGTNGAYNATNGWDCCTGLGTPNGTALLGLLLAQKNK